MFTSIKINELTFVRVKKFIHLQPRKKREFYIHNKFLVLIMPTIQQLVRTGRTQITKKSKSVVLDSCPQRRGFVRKFTLLHPKNQTLQCVK
jgi:small subunit ribosomal protein S12